MARQHRDAWVVTHGWQGVSRPKGLPSLHPCVIFPSGHARLAATYCLRATRRHYKQRVGLTVSPSILLRTVAWCWPCHRPPRPNFVTQWVLPFTGVLMLALFIRLVKLWERWLDVQIPLGWDRRRVERIGSEITSVSF
jgi:hypothetical protein